MRISDWSSDVCSSDLVTFESGTDIDRAQMDTQNRLRRVEARLPEEVRRQGIQVNRANAAFLMVVALHSPNGAQNTLRSEEHTSELQSLMRISYAVFCMKKKQACKIVKHTNTSIRVVPPTVEL